MIAAMSRGSRIPTVPVPGHGTKTNQLRQPIRIPLIHVTKSLNKQNPQTENNTAKFQEMEYKHTMETNKPNTSAFQEPLDGHSEDTIQVILTFQILDETERTQLRTLRRMAEKFVSHLSEEELEELEFSNTSMPGSHLERLPANMKIAKKLQIIFGIGSYKIIQSYLSPEQLSIVLIRNGSEMDPDRKIRGLQRISPVRLRTLRTNKVGPSFDTAGRKGRIPDTISESPEPIETTGRFIRHRRSNDYITLYDEIAKVGSSEDVTSITGSSEKDKQNGSSPSKMEGDSGYFSTSSEENSTKKRFEKAPVINPSSSTPHLSNLSPSSPTLPPRPFANRPILINCLTSNPTTSPVSKKPTRDYSNIPSPFRSRPLIPRESSNTGTSPTEETVASRLPVIRKKGLSELQPNARNIAPIIKPKVNVKATNQMGTPLASSDMMKHDPARLEQTNKKSKRPLINYAKLRRKTVEANTEVAASTTSASNSSESSNNEDNSKDRSPHHSTPTSNSLHKEKSTSTVFGTEDTTNTFSPPTSITSSTTGSEETKVKKPLKNFSKARLLAKKRKSQSNQSTTETNTEEVGRLEGFSPPSEAVTMPPCPSGDPDRPPSSLSRCSSASSLFIEYPPIPIDFVPKVKKPLKNFHKARISTRAKNTGSCYQAPIPNMEHTPVEVSERKASNSSLPKVAPMLSKGGFVKSDFLQYKTPPPAIIHHPIAQDLKKAIVDDQSLTVKPQLKGFAKYRAKTLSNDSLKELPIPEGQKAQPANTKTSEDTLSNTGVQNRSKDSHRIVNKPDSHLKQVPIMNTKTKRTVCPVSDPTSKGFPPLESVNLPDFTVGPSKNDRASARPRAITSRPKNSDARPPPAVQTQCATVKNSTTPTISLKPSSVETKGRKKLVVTPTDNHQKSSYRRILTWS